MRLYHLAFVAMLTIVPAPAGAADLEAPSQMLSQCPVPIHSAKLALHQADLNAIVLEVRHRYMHAIEVSQREAVIFSPSQAYTWAAATKLSCGKALGYLRSHELNTLQVNECNCFHRRMIKLLR